MRSENMTKRAVVIGSGFGGISAAIRLQARGVSTTLIDNRDKAGGKAYVYEDKGFRFDGGPTVITAHPAIKELFELAGKNMSDYVSLLPVEPYYKIFWEDGRTFDYSGDEKKFLSELHKGNPDDVEGYKQFLAYATEVFKEGYEKLCHVPFLNFKDMVKVAPQLIKLEAYRSIYSVVSKYIKDEQNRQVLSFSSLLIGGHPFKVSSIYSLIHPLEKKWGVHFAKGGTGALVKGLIKLFKDLGGQVLLADAAVEIQTAASKAIQVKTESGKVFVCDLVVSNADVHHTYSTLLKNEASASKKAHKLSKKNYSMSLFLIYFGLSRDYDHLEHHNILLCKRYKPLLDEIFKEKILTEDFSLYLHAPCKTDPSLAPEGMFNYYVLAPVPNLEKQDIDWDKIKDDYKDRVYEYMEKHYMPGLKESIVTERVFTPLDFERTQNAYKGASFSLEPTLTQSAYFRVSNRDKDISNLYFVGAGTHPGAGIPGVIGSAKATDSLIVKDFNL